MRDFLDLLFATGLTPTLVTTLGQFASKLTGLTCGIRDRLLEIIHLVLAKRPYRYTTGPIAEAAKAAAMVGVGMDGKEQDVLVRSGVVLVAVSSSL